MTTPVRIGIVGAGGRMGQALVRAVAAGDSVLSGALEQAGHASLGKDAGRLAGLDTAGVPITDAAAPFFAGIDVAIEFTVPEATVRHAAAAAEAGTGLVIGTTGLDHAQMDALRRAGASVPVVWSANMSVGINLLSHLVETAAAALGPAWDIEITEMHHAAKAHAPVGRRWPRPGSGRRAAGGSGGRRGARPGWRHRPEGTRDDRLRRAPGR